MTQGTLPRTDILIKQARGKAIQDDFGDEYGQSNSFFLESFRQAVVSLNTELVLQVTEPFKKWVDVPVVAGQESYSLPTDIFTENLVYEIYYSPTGRDEDTRDERLDYNLHRRFQEPLYASEPQLYSLAENRFYPFPVASAGKFKVLYERAIPAPDLRRGKVLAVSKSATQVTSLAMDTGTVDDEAITLFQAAEFICVHDSRGNLKMKNIPIEFYGDSNGAFSILDDAYTFEPGETIDVGDWVTIGANTTTHVPLKPACAPYIIEFMVNESLLQVSSTDTSQTNAKLNRILSQVVELYAQMPASSVRIG